MTRFAILLLSGVAFAGPALAECGHMTRQTTAQGTVTTPATPITTADASAPTGTVQR